MCRSGEYESRNVFTLGLPVEDVFQPCISKQAQEVIFSKTNVNALHPFLYLNRTPVIHCSHQKHLDCYLDRN